MAVWATLRIDDAEPTGLYFDKLNPNVAFVNVQHPLSGDDTLVQITAVPEPETFALADPRVDEWEAWNRSRDAAR